MKVLSNQAKVAKAIRQEMKRRGLVGTARSSSFSMGDSVDVAVMDQPPGVAKSLGEYAKQFQYGSFNGMEDLYEYNNRRRDLPQSKYVSVRNDISDPMRQEVYAYCRSYFAACESLPENYEEAQNLSVKYFGYVSQLVWQVFNGSLGKFWESRVTARCAPEFADFIDPTGALRKAGLLSVQGAA